MSLKKLGSVGSVATLGLLLMASSVASQAVRDSYPREALKLHQQGMVVTHLRIGTDGTVRSCSVKESSGSPSLDADACQKLVKGLHYGKLARDADGNAIESEVDMPLRYVLPR